MSEKVLFVCSTPPTDEYGGFYQFIIVKRKNRYILEILDIINEHGLRVWQHMYTYINTKQKDKIIQMLREGRFEELDEDEELNNKEFYIL